MRRTSMSLAAYATLFALALWVAPPTILAADGGRLEGLVMDLDGRAATSHRVHLIGAAGQDLGQSAVGEDGLYSFTGLPAGQYSLGIEMPDGSLAPVAAPPVRLAQDELARRDLKLVHSDADLVNGALQANYGLGEWWASLSKPGKTWTIIAIVIGAVLTYDALKSERKMSDPQPEPGSGG